MIDADPVASFDLPDECQHDHVVIYQNPDPYQPPYRAVPFEYVGDDDLGNGYYREPQVSGGLSAPSGPCSAGWSG